MFLYLNKICVPEQQVNENLTTHCHNYKKQWQGITRFRLYLIHDLTQPSPKQRLPVLLRFVQTIYLIRCHYKIF